MRTYLVGLILGSVALAACGNDSIAIGDLAKKIIAAQCANAVSCQQMPDTATCEASYQTNGMGFQTLVAAVNAKIIKYDGEAAASCANEFASQGCTFTGTEGVKNDPCSKMFTGTVAAGGACFINEECAGVGSSCNQTDPMCDTSTTCCPGTCTAGTPLQQAGGHCTVSSECNYGLYCSTTTSVCKAVVTQSGAACDEIDGCANPMYCNGDFNVSPFAGKCTTAPASGAACNPKDLLPCGDDRDYCDNGTMKCTRDVAVGGACDPGTTTTGNGSFCVGYAYCNSGTCAASPKAGATCDPANGPSCLGGLSCPTTTCVLPPAGTMACK